MRRKEPGMRHRALTAARPQGRINAAVGQVLAYQAVEQANRMQQAELARLGRLEALCIERRILPLRVYRGVAPGTPGATPRSSCRSCWTSSAPSSSSLIRDTRAPKRSAPGARRIAASGKL